jgi:hypothetical protein
MLTQDMVVEQLAEVLGIPDQLLDSKVPMLITIRLCYCLVSDTEQDSRISTWPLSGNGCLFFSIK